MQADTNKTMECADYDDDGAVVAAETVCDALRSQVHSTDSDQLIYGRDPSRRLPSAATTTTTIASSCDKRVTSYISRRLSHSESTDWCAATARCKSNGNGNVNSEATVKRCRVGRRSFAGSCSSNTSGRGRDGDMKARLERSRQSARECRARKKLRYQYLEELVAHREEAVLLLRQELEMYKQWCKEIDEGHIPEELLKKLAEGENSDRDLDDDGDDDDDNDEGDDGREAVTSVTSVTGES